MTCSWMFIRVMSGAYHVIHDEANSEDCRWTMKTRIVIELDVNESGIPFVERPREAVLECRVSSPAPERPTPQVHIQGNE